MARSSGLAGCLLVFLVLAFFAAAGQASSLKVGDGVVVMGGAEGQIIVRDTLEAGKAAFRSGKPVPAPGDWKGIRIEASSTGSKLSGSDIEHAGLSGSAALEIRKASPLLLDLGVRNNAGPGIRLLGASPSVLESVISNNSVGIEADNGAVPLIENTVFTGNGTAVLNRDASATVKAMLNWWGHPTGPLDPVDDTSIGGFYNPGGLGNQVSGGVNYSPWLGFEPILGSSFRIAEGDLTSSPAITLQFTCRSCAELRVSESPAFTNTPFQPYSLTMPFSLSSGDALKTLYAQFRASTGNTGTTKSVQVRLDTAGPTLGVASPSSGQVLKRPLTVSATATDPAGVKKVEFYVDGALAHTATSGYSYFWDITSVADGGHELKVIAHDNIGHMSTAVLPVTVTKTPPAAPLITAPATGSIISSSAVNVLGSAEPGISVTLYLGGKFNAATVAGPGGSFQFPGVTLAEGMNVLEAAASDKAGASPLSSAVLVAVDTGPPPPPIINKITSTPGGMIKLGWVPGFGEVPVRYRLYRAGIAFSSKSQAHLVYDGSAIAFDDIPSTDGTYHYGATAMDAAGNESGLSDLVSAFSDRVAPSASVEFTPAVSGPGNVSVKLILSEAVAGAPYLGITPLGGDTAAVGLSRVTDTEWTGAYSIAPGAPNGIAAFIFSAKDAAGNKGASISAAAPLYIDTAGPSGTLARAPSLAIYRPGPVLLTLSLNEPAASAPSLVFNPPAGGQVFVPLAGSGASWTGSLEVTDAMGDGTGAFAMSAVDQFGNTGITLAGASMPLDVTPPAQPGGLTAQSRPEGRVALNWSLVSDAASYRLYRVEGGGPVALPATPPAVLSAASYTDAPPVDGSYTYAVSAVDPAGNESALSNEAGAVSDRVPPAPPTAFTAGISGTDVLASWSAPAGEGLLSYSLYRSVSPINTVSGLVPVKQGITLASAVDTPGMDATYHYAVTAVDPSGNESQPSASESVLYDLAPPVITITGVADGAFLGSPVIPGITVTDSSLQNVVSNLDGAVYTPGTLISAEGAHLLKVNAEDATGKSSSKEVSFTIDLTDPVINITGVAEGVMYSAPVTPVVSATDANLDQVDVKFNGAAHTPGTQVSSDGAHTLSVTAKDKAGRTASLSVAFMIDGPPPPPADISVVLSGAGRAAISWTPSAAGDVTGYRVYRNGQPLTVSPVSVLSYNDDSYGDGSLQVYGVAAVDSSGFEGSKADASVLPVGVSVARYGKALGTGFVLNKHYIEGIRLEVSNRHSFSGDIGPLNMELRDHLGVFASAARAKATYAAGEGRALETVFPAGEGIVDYRKLSVDMDLPSGPGYSVKYSRVFDLAALDPGRKIEIFNEPIVKGAMAKVRLKIYNHGSVPVEVITARGDKPSDDVYVLVKDAAGNVLGKGYLNQKGAGVINYGSYALAEIPAGGSFLTAPVEVLVPFTAGDTVYFEAMAEKTYYRYGKADQVTGGRLDGQATASASAAPYYGTISSDKGSYDQESDVILSGEALDALTGLPVPGVPVRIGITVKGFDRNLLAITDQDGKYSVVFRPLGGEAGQYSVWATHPDVQDKPLQAGFIIHGMTIDPRAVNVRMSKNSSFTFSATLKNIGETDLTGLQFALIGGSGITGAVDSSGLTALKGGAAASFKVTINAAVGAPDASSATVLVSSSEGVSRAMEANLSLLPAVPAIKTDPGYIETGLNTNSVRTVTFKLKNVGYAPLENISFEPPAAGWMTLAAGAEIKTLDPGASADVSLVLRPPADTSQGLHIDKIVIASGNHVPYTVNIFTMVSSSEKGGVKFKAVNALNNLVKDASVIIGHQQVTTLVLSGKTDAAGELAFSDIPIGMYNYKVQAPGHEIVTGTFEVIPEVTTPLAVFMNNVFVTLEWSVKPMTIFDKYEIKLVATFETQVPAPVITIDPGFERLEIEIGSTYAGEYTVTNHGLVAVDDVKINIGGGPGLSVETLITELPRLGAKETVKIPYRITVNRFKSPEPVDGCSTIPMQINVGGSYMCAFGIRVGSGATAAKSIIPKDRYDPLGLCEVECDWCKCLLEQRASALCSCLTGKSGTVSEGVDRTCNCVQAFVKSEDANTLCGCINGAAGNTKSAIECVDAVHGSAVSAAFKTLASLLDAFKNGFSCGLCLKDLLPSIPTGTYSGGGGYGGGYGGGGSFPSGGFSISGGGCN